MEKPMTVDDKFLRNMQSKHNTKEKDPISLKQNTMENILKDVLQVPDKLHMISSPDRVSVKTKKEGENPLHTGAGKDFSKSTMS